MMSQSSKDVYESLCAHQPVEGLGDLPIDEILTTLQEVFPAAQRESTTSGDSLIWHGPHIEDTFTVTWSAQHFIAACLHVQLDDVNRIVAVATQYGCPLYDPQTGERFRLASP
jgi:hypothetical protein